MTTRIALSAVAAIAMIGASSAPAFALLSSNGAACTVGFQANCAQDDPDDATAGHIVLPTGTVTTTTYNGDTGEATTTTSPASTPSPTPAD